MRENFDFSKLKDQQKFEKLPQESQDIFVGKSQQEADELERKIIETTQAENYEEANQQFEKEVRELTDNPENTLKIFTIC